MWRSSSYKVLIIGEEFYYIMSCNYLKQEMEIFFIHFVYGGLLVIRW